MYPFFLVPVFVIYGTDGFQAQLQLFQPNDVWLLTAGELLLILIGLSLVTALFHSAAAMVLGERLKSNMTPMAVMVGFLLFSLLFNIPEQYRILSQIWDYVPRTFWLIGGLSVTAWYLSPDITCANGR